ncbi:MAG: hypothetical protein HZC02_02825 [Candidatus Levybacteria bacterium]|nr:hypothetical protein [Candidatus Levybacteria bacterium]
MANDPEEARTIWESLRLWEKIGLFICVGIIVSTLFLLFFHPGGNSSLFDLIEEVFFLDISLHGSFLSHFVGFGGRGFSYSLPFLSLTFSASLYLFLFTLLQHILCYLYSLNITN